MAAVFSAFDRPIYQCIIPQHSADMLCFPAPVLQHLKNGEISVYLSEGTGHAVGIDEAHEMKINKDAKFAVVRPSEEMMEISNFTPFHAKCLNNLKQHLRMKKQPSKTLPTSTSRDRVADRNIQAMLDLMEECDMLPSSSDECRLQNHLTNTPATPEQTHDLLTFRQIGQAEFEAHVNYHILHILSTNAPCRQKRLQILASTKAMKKKLSEIDKSA